MAAGIAKRILLFYPAWISGQKEAVTVVAKSRPFTVARRGRARFL